MFNPFLENSKIENRHLEGRKTIHLRPEICFLTLLNKGLHKFPYLHTHIMPTYMLTFTVGRNWETGCQFLFCIDWCNQAWHYSMKYVTNDVRVYITRLQCSMKVIFQKEKAESLSCTLLCLVHWGLIWARDFVSLVTKVSASNLQIIIKKEKYKGKTLKMGEKRVHAMCRCVLYW